MFLSPYDSIQGLISPTAAYNFARVEFLVIIICMDKEKFCQFQLCICNEVEKKERFSKLFSFTVKKHFTVRRSDIKESTNIFFFINEDSNVIFEFLLIK